MKSPVITKTLVVSEKTKEMMVDYFTEFKRDKTPQYAIFQADDGDTVVRQYFKEGMLIWLLTFGLKLKR